MIRDISNSNRRNDMPMVSIEENFSMNESRTNDMPQFSTEEKNLLTAPYKEDE
jgi:hypothetical protein